MTETPSNHAPFVVRYESTPALMTRAIDEAWVEIPAFVSQSRRDRFSMIARSVLLAPVIFFAVIGCDTSANLLSPNPPPPIDLGLPIIVAIAAVLLGVFGKRSAAQTFKTQMMASVTKPGAMCLFGPCAITLTDTATEVRTPTAVQRRSWTTYCSVIESKSFLFLVIEPLSYVEIDKQALGNPASIAACKLFAEQRIAAAAEDRVACTAAFAADLEPWQKNDRTITPGDARMSP